MVRKWVHKLTGILFLLMAAMYMVSYSTQGYVRIKGSTFTGTPAFVVIFLHVLIGIISLVSVNRKYGKLKKLGYHPIDPNQIQENEAFRREYDDYTLTFYSWRDTKFEGQSVHYGYRGLYMTLDLHGRDKNHFAKLDDLFDKKDNHDETIVYFKEECFVDEDDLPELINDIHEVLGEKSQFFNSRFLRKITDRYWYRTKLDFGKHIKQNLFADFVRACFFVLPHTLLVIYINLFFKAELSEIFGLQSVFFNNFLASVITVLIGSWIFIKSVFTDRVYESYSNNFDYRKFNTRISVGIVLLGLGRLVYIFLF